MSYILINNILFIQRKKLIWCKEILKKVQCHLLHHVEWIVNTVCDFGANTVKVQFFTIMLCMYFLKHSYICTVLSTRHYKVVYAISTYKMYVVLWEISTGMILYHIFFCIFLTLLHVCYLIPAYWSCFTAYYSVGLTNTYCAPRMYCKPRIPLLHLLIKFYPFSFMVVRTWHLPVNIILYTVYL